MERAQVFETVKKYILEQLSVSPDRVTESAAMVDDLGADSANLMMLVMDLEAEFNMTVEDDAISAIRTVGDIVDYIVKKA
ncbi:MAG: acyl carrier protein [Candidatus Faecivicinus sp.]